jgi:hypothetical protein
VSGRQEFELRSSELREPSVQCGEPVLAANSERREIRIADELAGWHPVREQRWQSRVETGRLGNEIDALVLKQGVNNIPGRNRRERLIAHGGCADKQTHDAELHQSARERFSGNQLFKQAQSQSVVDMVNGQQRQE